MELFESSKNSETKLKGKFLLNVLIQNFVEITDEKVESEEKEKALNIDDKSNKLEEKLNEWIYLEPSTTYGMSGEIKHDPEAIAPGAICLSLFRNSIEFGDVKVIFSNK